MVRAMANGRLKLSAAPAICRVCFSTECRVLVEPDLRTAQPDRPYCPKGRSYEVSEPDGFDTDRENTVLQNFKGVRSQDQNVSYWH